MADVDTILSDLDYKPPLPQRRRRIGLIGAGRIIRIGHLPAYRQAGFEVVAIASRTRENAEEVARQWGIPRVHDTWQDLVRDAEVEVVDSGYPPHLNLEIARATAAARKPTLFSKPLACSYADSVAIVRLAEAAGVPFAVMQNGRWDPASRAVKRILERGLLGEPRLIMLHARRRIKWMPYYVSDNYRQIMVLNVTVHHLDTCRMLLGDPSSVWANLGGYPDQPGSGETMATYSLAYANGAQASGIENGWAAAGDDESWFRVDGTAGTVRGTLGYATHGPATFDLRLRDRPGWRYSPALQGSWFPDSFAGPMGDLMCALEEERLPETSVQDNLRTMRLVFALYKAHEEKRAVSPEDVA